MKTLTTTMALAFLAAGVFQPQTADAAKACDDDTVAMVMEQVMEAPDEAKAMAEEEFAMAKEKMEAGMMDECSGHLEKASMLAEPES